MYLGGPVAPSCTINKTKSSSSCLQLELVLFYYLRLWNPRAVLDSPMKILIDNGHGLNTPGKRSPDGKFLEAIYNREIARRVVADLRDRGYDAELLVPEEEDIPLKERVRHARQY